MRKREVGGKKERWEGIERGKEEERGRREGREREREERGHKGRKD